MLYYGVSVMYCKHEIICINCGCTKIQSKHSSRGLYCSIKCQHEYAFKQYIERWKAGLESGLSGKKNISRHIRRYILIKFNHACCECGWNKVHPSDGKSTLEVDHIDGDWMNTTESNLRLLCPNCHSLTMTYKSRNRGNSSRQYNDAEVA